MVLQTAYYGGVLPSYSLLGGYFKVQTAILFEFQVLVAPWRLLRKKMDVALSLCPVK